MLKTKGLRALSVEPEAMAFKTRVEQLGEAGT
jgi:hypothetical protein